MLATGSQVKVRPAIRCGTMLLRFPFPESGESVSAAAESPTSSGMDRACARQRLQLASSPVTKRKECRAGFSRFGARLALVSLVFLLRVTSPGGGAAAARLFEDRAPSSLDGATAAVFPSGSVPPRVQTLLTESGPLFDRRRLLQVQPSNTTRPLAVRGDRRDPLDGFKKYRQGYDVKNKHYWASAVYTGVYGFAIAAAWFLLGVLLVLAACCKLCCCRRQKSSEPRSSFYSWFPRILVLLFTLFAIGCIVTLFIRNKQFHTQAFRLRNSISSSADDATDAVRNVSSTLSEVDALVSRYNIAGLQQIGSTVTKLNEQAASITKDVDDNLRTYNRLVNGIEIALIVILSVTLSLVIVGLVAAFMGWRALLFLVIVLGWLLTVLTWILFGLFFAVNNITMDTCQAFTEYLQAPANTTLDDLLPCVDLATASSASNLAREGVNNIVGQANNVVAQINQASAQLGRTATVPRVCDPIGAAPDYVYSGTCPEGTVPIGQLPQAVQSFVCPQDPLSNACLAEGRVVTPTQNTTIADFSRGGQSLVSIIPTVTSLTNCSFVYNTFNTVVTQRCSPTKHALRNMWIPLLLLSIAMTFLTVSWILANHRNKKSRSIHARQDSPRSTLPK